MTNEWKPNYRTRPGVEVMATLERGLWRAKSANLGDILSGAHCDPAEFTALFEPIPQPVMVKIPLDVARLLAIRNNSKWDRCAELDDAIAAAQRENP